MLESINAKDVEILDVQATLKFETSIYAKTYENEQEIIVRENDLSAPQSMLKLARL